MFSDLVYGLKELRDSCHAYEKAEAYYEGTNEEAFVSINMARLLRGTQNNFKVNLAKRPVDAVLDRLEIAAITSPEEKITTFINEEFWMANQMAIEAHDIHRAAEMFGDAYLFVWGSGSSDDVDDLDEDEIPDADESITGPNTLGFAYGGVDVFYNSPLTVRMFYDEENPRKKRFAIKRWEQGGRVRVNLYYPDVIEKYVSKLKNELTGNDYDDYIIFTDDEAVDDHGVVPNPYGEVPFFHFRTARPYGKPEHYDAYGPQDALTKLITNMMSTSDFAAWPQRYATAAMGSPGDDDDLDTGLSTDETMAPENMFSKLVSGPGKVWLLRNIDKVGQFQAADVRNFLEPIEKFVHMMSATTATPMPYFDPSREIPSGEAQRALEAPLVKKINARQRSYGATWREAIKFTLEKILGLGENIEVTVRWDATQVINDLTGWQAISEKQRAGVPTRQCLLEAGYTEAEVDLWGYTEAEPWGPYGRPEFDLYGTSFNSPFVDDQQEQNAGNPNGGKSGNLAKNGSKKPAEKKPAREGAND